MPLLLAFILYGGSFTGYVAYDKVIQPYIQQQVEQEKKDFPIDKLGLKIEQENEVFFANLTFDDENDNQERGWETLPEYIKSEGPGPNDK